MPLSQNCDHETNPGQRCARPAKWLALSTRPTDPWAAHDSESASVRVFCSHEHAKGEHRPKLAAAQRAYEDAAALRNDKPVLDAWRWALAAYPEPVEMYITKEKTVTDYEAGMDAWRDHQRREDQARRSHMITCIRVDALEAARSLASNALGYVQAQQNDPALYDKLSALCRSLDSASTPATPGRRFGDAIDRLAAAITGLDQETTNGILYFEIFRHIVDDECSNGYGTMAGVLANIFTKLPDDARNEAIAELICGLFNHMGANMFCGIVRGVMERLPDGALSDEDAEFVTAQLLTEA